MNFVVTRVQQSLIEGTEMDVDEGENLKSVAAELALAFNDWETLSLNVEEIDG